MAHEFNSDDWKFNNSNGASGDHSSDASDVARSIGANEEAKRRAAKGKVRTFKDDMLYAAENARRQAENTPTPADVATIKSMAANNASSRIVTGGRQYTPKSSFMDKAGRVAGAVGSTYDNTKELAGRAAGGLKKSVSSAMSSLDFSKDDKSIDDTMDEGLNKVKENAQSTGGNTLFVGGKVVSATASSIDSAVKKNRARKQAAVQAQIERLRQKSAVQAQSSSINGQAQLNGAPINGGKNDRFTDKNDKFANKADRFGKADRFDDKSDRFTSEVSEKGAYKAKADDDIAKAAAMRNADRLKNEKAAKGSNGAVNSNDSANAVNNGVSAQKSGQIDAVQKKSKYADRFIDPDKKKSNTTAVAGAGGVAVSKGTRLSVASEQAKSRADLEKKKFDKKSKKNTSLSLSSNSGKKIGGKRSKGLLKKVAKMSVVNAIKSGALVMDEAGRLGEGVRQGGGDGIAQKSMNAMRRLGDAVKAVFKGLFKIISFVIRHPIISLFLILIILIFIAVLVAIDGMTSHWGLAQGAATATFQANEKLQSQKRHLPVTTIRGSTEMQIWGGAKSIDYSDEAAAALIGDALMISAGDSAYDDGEKIGLWGFRYDTGDAEKLKAYAEEHDRDWTDVAVQLSFFYENDNDLGLWFEALSDIDTGIYVLDKKHFPTDAYNYGERTAERSLAKHWADTYYEEFKGETFISGNDITDFALQFVGNAYCLGGDNLEGHIPGQDGIDCSHFIYRVLQETGHYDGGYVTSKQWANLGTAVNSLSDVREGDVAVYDGQPYGHVVFIVENLGDGRCDIVHAKGTKWGIVHEVVDIYNQHGPGNFLGFRRFT